MSKELSCSDKTKIKMGNALKALMLDTPFEKITISDITDKCQIHRQTFYYHFQDRYELLDWIIYTDLINPLLSDFTFENMFDKILETFKTLQTDKKFYQNAFNSNLSNFSRYINSIATEQIVGIIQRINKENGVNATAEQEIIIANFFGYGISGVTYNWVINGMNESPEAMTNCIRVLFENSVQIAKKS